MSHDHWLRSFTGPDPALFSGTHKETERLPSFIMAGEEVQTALHTLSGQINALQTAQQTSGHSGFLGQLNPISF